MNSSGIIYFLSILQEKEKELDRYYIWDAFSL